MFEAPNRTGMLHADPHPGNFRQLPAADGGPGRLGVLDFGAVARLPEGKLPRSIGALIRIAEFFRHESCGQCVPCRVGTVRQEELLRRLRDERPLGGHEEEIALLAELGAAMRDASICGLGQTASAAIESAFERFDPFPRPAPR